MTTMFEGSMQAAQCRSCKAEILWGRTPKGKRMPLDRKPVTLWTLTSRGEENLEAVKGWQSHYATCPDAERWSSGKGVSRSPTTGRRT